MQSSETQSHRMSASTVFLFSGFWNFAQIDRKKAVREINVAVSAPLRREIERKLGVAEFFKLSIVDSDGTVHPLFPTDPNRKASTLVSTVLQSLIPERFQLVERSVVQLVSGKNHGELANLSAAADPVYLLSTSYITTFRDLRIAIDAIRKLKPGPLVVGGYLATRNPQRALEEGADVVCIGDAEPTIAGLLDSIHAREQWAAIPNLAYMKEGQYFKTVSHLTELDAVPLAVPRGSLAHHSVPYESMRGCPYKCAFCSYPLVSTTWRYKSARKMIADFAEIERRGANRIIALDSTFTVPKQRIREFLQLYLEKDLRIPWGAYSRTPVLCEEDIVELLARTNCRWLSVGFESGSDVILRNMNKKTTVAQSIVALANLKKNRIAPVSNFIIGFPGETDDTIRETVDLITGHLFGFYGMYVFNIRDRFMPALNNEAFHIEYSDIGGEWSHCTMTSEVAMAKRVQAYASIVFRSEQAINVDIFNGTAVDIYNPWNPAFPVLKNIEKLVALTVYPEAFTEAERNSERAIVEATKELLSGHRQSPVTIGA